VILIKAMLLSLAKAGGCTLTKLPPPSRGRVGEGVEAQPKQMILYPSSQPSSLLMGEGI